MDWVRRREELSSGYLKELKVRYPDFGTEANPLGLAAYKQPTMI